jgi:hypothetical protein
MEPAGLAAQPPAEEEQRARQVQDRRRLLTLWVVVTALWTAATLLRIERVWVPRAGWDHVLRQPWLWLSLSAPPLIFALLFIYVHHAIELRRRVASGSSPQRSRRGSPAAAPSDAARRRAIAKSETRFQSR